MADEIGEAMQRVGGTAGAVGIQFEKVASWIATVSSKTRESSYTIGNSIKSILARVQSLKESGFDETDGTQVNDVAKALSEVNIALTNADGTFRNFGVVMDELGAKWSSIDNRTKAYLATTIAGSYQQARFLSLMEGYPQSIDLYTKSLDSAGIATEKFNLYQEGTEAHLTKLKNAWTGVFQTSFNSSGIREAIDALTVLAQAFDSLISKVGITPLIFGLGAGAILLMSSNARSAYNWLSKMSIEMFKIGKDKTLANSVSQASAGLSRVATNAQKATISIKGIGTAVKTTAISIGASIAPMLAILAVTTVISKFIQSAQEAKEKAKELEDQNKKIASAWDGQRDKIEKLVDQYKELDNVTKEGTVFSNSEQEATYYKVMTDLAELMPNLVKTIDDKGQAHIKNKEALQEEIKYTNQLSEAQRTLRIAESQRTTKELSDKLKASKDTKDENYNKYLKSLVGVPANSNLFQEKVAQYGIQLGEDEKNIKEKSDAIRQHFKQMTDDLIKDSNTKFGQEIKDQMDVMISGLSFEDDKDVTNKESQIRSFINNIIDIKKQLNSEDISDNRLSSAIEQIKNDARDFGIKDVTKFAEGFLNIGKSAEDASHQVKSFKQLTDELNSEYKKSSDILSTLNGMLQDNAEGKALSAKEVMDLVDKDASLVDMFKIENGVIKLNIDAVNKRRDAELQSFSDIAKARQEQLQNQSTELIKKMNFYKIELQAIQNITDAENARAGIVKTRAQVAESIWSSTASEFQQISDYMKSSDDFDQATNYVDQMESLMKQAELAKSALGSIGTDSNSSKQNKKAIEAFDDEAQKFKDAIYDIEVALKNSEDALATYPKYSQDYRNELEEEMRLLTEKQNLYHAENDRLRQRKSALEQQISVMGNYNSLSDENKEKLNDLKKDLADVTQNIKENSESWNDANKTIRAKSYEEMTSKLEEFDKANEELNDTLSISKDRLSTYTEGTKEWKDEVSSQVLMYKELQNQAHQQKLLIDEQLASDKLNLAQKEELNKKIKELQKSWWSYESTIKSLNDQLQKMNEDTANSIIDSLKDVFKQQKELVEDNLDTQLKAINEAHDAQMKALDAEQDAYDKLIKAKKDYLSKQQDDRKYGQDLSKAQEANQGLRNQIAIAELDKSAEGQKKLRDLKKQLADSDMEIENMKYDHSIELQQDELDKLSDIEKEKIDNAKENYEVTIKLKDKEVKMKYQLAVDALNKEKDANAKFYNDLINSESTWNKLREDITQGHLDAVSAQFEVFKQNLQSNAKVLGDELQKNLIDKLNALGGQAGAVKSADSVIKDIQQMQANADAWNNTSDKTVKDQLSNSNKEIGKRNGWVYDSASGTWWRDYIGGTPLFHEGGVVGNATGKTKMTEIVNKMFNTKPNEQIVKALKGELYVPEQNITENFLPNMKKLVSMATPVVASDSGVIYNIQVLIDKVMGDENGANSIASRIVGAVQKRGGRMGR